MVLKSYCKGLKVDRDFVAEAYASWLVAPAGRKNGWRVEKDFVGEDALIDEIAGEIATRTLQFEPIRRYEHKEPTNGKVRTIGILSVKQQVCDYVMASALEPLLNAKIGFYQVAGVKGKGQKLARSAIRRWSREGGYHVKLDVSKCYPSISHDLVMRILRKHVRSSDVLYLAETMLETHGTGEMVDMETGEVIGMGLEIGSYFALLMANLVLSYAYHFIEGLHKERRGKRRTLVRHQAWHLDDAVLVSADKRDLKMAVRALVKFMREELGLSVKPWKVAKMGDTEPLDLGGYIARDGRVTLRAGLFLRAKRAIARFSRRHTITLARRVCSYWGWLKHSQSLGFIVRNGVHGLMKIARAMISKASIREETCRLLRAQQS